MGAFCLGLSQQSVLGATPRCVVGSIIMRRCGVYCSVLCEVLAIGRVFVWILHSGVLQVMHNVRDVPEVHAGAILPLRHGMVSDRLHCQ